jgi:hypothetical protein
MEKLFIENSTAINAPEKIVVKSLLNSRRNYSLMQRMDSPENFVVLESHVTA